jgi:hypothetical protein
MFPGMEVRAAVYDAPAVVSGVVEWIEKEFE